MNRAGAVGGLHAGGDPGRAVAGVGPLGSVRRASCCASRIARAATSCIGPTHEEVITDLVRGDVRSYRQLPLNLYQVQTKFRDELRPRAGLMRGREFIMKDAYSFHVDEKDAHPRVRRRCTTRTRASSSAAGSTFRAVEADTGTIGGSLSHEFQVLAETGEDAIVACDQLRLRRQRRAGGEPRRRAGGGGAPSGARAPRSPRSRRPASTPSRRSPRS